MKTVTSGYGVRVNGELNTNLDSFKLAALAGVYMSDENREFLFNLISIKDWFIYQMDCTTRNRKKVIKETFNKLQRLFTDFYGKEGCDEIMSNVNNYDKEVVYNNPMYLTMFFSIVIGDILKATFKKNNIGNVVA